MPRKSQWPIDPGSLGWRVVLDLLNSGVKSRHDGNQWRFTSGFAINWRTIVPLLRAKLVQIESVPRSRRRVMSLTTTGFTWARRRQRHVSSEGFQRVSKIRVQQARITRSKKLMELT